MGRVDPKLSAWVPPMRGPARRMYCRNESSAFFWRECAFPHTLPHLYKRRPTWVAHLQILAAWALLDDRPLTRPSRRRVASGLSAKRTSATLFARASRHGGLKIRRFTPFAKGFFIFSPSSQCAAGFSDRRYRARRIARARAGDRAASGDTSGCALFEATAAVAREASETASMAYPGIAAPPRRLARFSRQPDYERDLRRRLD